MIRLKILAGAAAVALLAGTALAQETIKVGVNEPLTGPFAASGTYVVNGARIAADEINAKGGVLGKKIELVIEDNKSNPTEAAAVAEKLITRDKVPVIMVEQNAYAALEMCDYAYLLESGVIATSGKGADLIGNPHVQAAYLGG